MGFSWSLVREGERMYCDVSLSVVAMRRLSRCEYRTCRSNVLVRGGVA